MYNKQGKPSTWGINKYVKENQQSLIKELQSVIKDTLFLDVEIKSQDLSEYTDYDSLDLGYHISYTDGSDEIIIDNRERYFAYDINDLSRYKKINLTTYNAFVKTIIIHELMHTYFLQIVIQCKFYGLNVYKEYDYRQMMNIKIYPNIEEYDGAIFIEEGVCQYIIEEMKLQIPNKPFTPKTIDDFHNKNNEFNIKYSYSVQFLKNFLDSNGLKDGISILITNKPPTYEEILKPELYFKRLNYGNIN
jgi:hypothetical protein